MSKFIQAVRYLAGGLCPGLDGPQASQKPCPDEELIPVLTEKYRRLQQGTAQTSEIPAPVASIVIPVRVSESPRKFLFAMQSLLQNGGAPPTEVVVVLNEKLSAADIATTQIADFADRIGLRSVILSYYDNPEYREIERPLHIFVARQAGSEAATGNIIIAADIDNIFAPNWIKAYADAFAGDPDLLLAYGPVGIQGLNGVSGRLIAWISTLAKAIKILINFPPYAGHNHAMRKQVIERVPNLYTKRIVLHENEVPVVVGKALSLTGDDNYVRCLPEAIIKTDYSQVDHTFAGAVRWIFKSSCRNIQQMKRLWTA